MREKERNEPTNIFWSNNSQAALFRPHPPQQTTTATTAMTRHIHGIYEIRRMFQLLISKKNESRNTSPISDSLETCILSQIKRTHSFRRLTQHQQDRNLNKKCVNFESYIIWSLFRACCENRYVLDIGLTMDWLGYGCLYYIWIRDVLLLGIGVIMKYEFRVDTSRGEIAIMNALVDKIFVCINKLKLATNNWMDIQIWWDLFGLWFWRKSNCSGDDMGRMERICMGYIRACSKRHCTNAWGMFTGGFQLNQCTYT